MESLFVNSSPPLFADLQGRCHENFELRVFMIKTTWSSVSYPKTVSIVASKSSVYSNSPLNLCCGTRAPPEDGRHFLFNSQKLTCLDRLGLGVYFSSLNNFRLNVCLKNVSRRQDYCIDPLAWQLIDARGPQEGPILIRGPLLRMAAGGGCMHFRESKITFILASKDATCFHA